MAKSGSGHVHLLLLIDYRASSQARSPEATRHPADSALSLLWYFGSRRVARDTRTPVELGWYGFSKKRAPLSTSQRARRERLRPLEAHFLLKGHDHERCGCLGPQGVLSLVERACVALQAAFCDRLGRTRRRPDVLPPRLRWCVSAPHQWMSGAADRLNGAALGNVC